MYLMDSNLVDYRSYSTVTALLPIILFPLTGGLELSETTASFAHKYVSSMWGGFIIAIAIAIEK